MDEQWSRDYVQCALIRRMAEKGEDLSLPASVVARIIKDAVSAYGKTCLLTSLWYKHSCILVFWVSPTAYTKG